MEGLNSAHLVPGACCHLTALYPSAQQTTDGHCLPRTTTAQVCRVRAGSHRTLLFLQPHELSAHPEALGCRAEAGGQPPTYSPPAWGDCCVALGQEQHQGGLHLGTAGFRLPCQVAPRGGLGPLAEGWASTSRHWAGWLRIHKALSTGII